MDCFSPSGIVLHVEVGGTSRCCGQASLRRSQDGAGLACACACLTPADQPLLPPRAFCDAPTLPVVCAAGTPHPRGKHKGGSSALSDAAGDRQGHPGGGGAAGHCWCRGGANRAGSAGGDAGAAWWRRQLECAAGEWRPWGLQQRRTGLRTGQHVGCPAGREQLPCWPATNSASMIVDFLSLGDWGLPAQRPRARCVTQTWTEAIL